MKTKKLGEFLKKYGFYMAVGVICVGALVTIFLSPNGEGNIQDEANPYAQNQEAGGSLVEDANELNDPTSEEAMPNPADTITEEDDLDQSADSNLGDVDGTQAEQTEVSEGITSESQVGEEEIVTETFESTTATVTTEPFFAEGDQFAWPVVGEVVVPYTDETTKHWFSESLNQTMRTFGVCIAASEGDSVKAVADGKVVEIVDDSSTLLTDMPYVGKTMIIDHGNGYISYYGFQNGMPDTSILGEVVSAGDVIGTVGAPAGAFIGVGDNIYLQVTHNDKIVSPLDYFEENTASVEVSETSELAE